MSAPSVNTTGDKTRWLIGEFLIVWSMVEGWLRVHVGHLQSDLQIEWDQRVVPEERVSDLIKQWRKLVIRQSWFTKETLPELDRLVTSLKGLAGVRNMLSHGHLVNISSEDGVLDIMYRKGGDAKERNYEITLTHFERLVTQLLFAKNMPGLFIAHLDPKLRSQSLRQYHGAFPDGGTVIPLAATL